MEDDVELTVRHARARIDGDTARVEVTTDRGRVTLRMHRLALGALGGAIARALWPKAGEDVPVFAGAEPQDVPIQPASEPEGEPVGAGVAAALQDVPIQPASQEPEGESVGAGDGAELQDVPIQPASQEPEGESVGAQADIDPHDISAQHEAREPDEVIVAFDALWPEGEEPVAPSAGVEPNNIPTQPESQDREGEGGAAFTGAEPHHVPTQPEVDAPAGELASLAGAEPPNDAMRAEQPARRRKASGHTPRRKWR
jgi:hypothetical protein